MINEQGLSISHVSQTTDIGVSALRRGTQRYEAEQQGRPGIGKPLMPEGNPPFLEHAKSRG